MRKTLQIVSWLSLAAMMVGPAMYLAGRMELPAVKIWMLVFTVVWFATVPLWMDRKKEG
jgi:hypothetical protein